MPGLDIGHLVLIAFVAILVIGPDRLPKIAQRLREFTFEGAKAQREFTRALQEGLREGETGESGNAPAATAPSGPRWQDFAFHLEELRNRLVISSAAILVLTLISYIFSDTIIHILRAPANNIVLHAFSPMDGFIIKFRVALYSGLVLAIPVWVYQVFAFFAPGIWPELEQARRERKTRPENKPASARFRLAKYRKQYWLAVLTIGASFALFLVGAAFGYLMLSNMVSVLLTMFGSEIDYFPNADQCISFVTFFLIAMGFAVELPLVMLILIRIGILPTELLRRQRRIVYFLLFVFAELITPVSDPIVAPMVVMLPMVVLFELALFLSRFITPKPKPASPVPATPGTTEQETPKDGTENTKKSD